MLKDYLNHFGGEHHQNAKIFLDNIWYRQQIGDKLQTGEL